MPRERTEEWPPVENRIVHFSGWFIRMRWLAGLIAGFLIILVVRIFDYLENETFWPLLTLVMLLLAANLFFTLCLKRRWYLRHLIELQTGTDLVILTAMLHFSGGIENPLLLAYIVHVIIGGILLDKRKCYVIAVSSFVLFAFVAFTEMTGLTKHHSLLIFPHGTHQVEGQALPMDAGDLDETAGPVEGRPFEGEVSIEPAHDPVYVASVVTLQLLFMLLVAIFVTTMMDRLHVEEDELKAESQRLERVVDATGTGLAILDPSLKPVWMNAQIRSWLNLSATREDEALPGAEGWFGGPDGPEGKTVRDGEVRIDTRSRVDSEGNTRVYQVTISPLKDRAGKVSEVVQLTQDITEHKMLEDEMIHSEKMMVLGIMAAGIAHEVGNPLASISTRLRLLEESEDEKLIKDSIGLLQDQISRIARIVHGVSSFARQGAMKKGPCPINVPVREALDILRFHRLAKVVTIHTELAPGLPEINAVKDHLVQIFLNLGLNALEA
ncbi:MAG: PAS domain-containing protein, partial [Candidatus Hydrogenedentes bacterium]|nr:PAS domain-containing protein [Candidatus Hydrogenedentota bacterium]